jgi:hypothetical protein
MIQNYQRPFWKWKLQDPTIRSFENKEIGHLNEILFLQIERIDFIWGHDCEAPKKDSTAPKKCIHRTAPNFKVFLRSDEPK